MKYCPDCARPLEVRWIDGRERKACGSPACGFVHWGNPVPVVAALVQYRSMTVLARNAHWPPDRFSLITGYLEAHESPPQAAAREVKEELGLDALAVGLIGCFPLFENNQVILAYWVTTSGELRTGSEISEVRLVTRERLKVYEFGRLAVTSAIVKAWLDGRSTRATS